MNYDHYKTWIRDRLVNRTDFYNRFMVDDRPAYVLNPQYMPMRGLTDDVLLSAAKGEVVIALYSLGQDGSKWACVDLDDRGQTGAEDLGLRAFGIADELNQYQPMIERTGRGFHVWLFFARPIDPTAAYDIVKPYAATHETMPSSGRFDRYPQLGTAVAVPSRHRFVAATNAIWNGSAWIEWGNEGFVPLITQWRGIDPVEFGLREQEKPPAALIPRGTRRIAKRVCPECKAELCGTCGGIRCKECGWTPTKK